MHRERIPTPGLYFILTWPFREGECTQNHGAFRLPLLTKINLSFFVSEIFPDARDRDGEIKFMLHCTPELMALSEAVMTFWTNFAHSGSVTIDFMIKENSLKSAIYLPTKSQFLSYFLETPTSRKISQLEHLNGLYIKLGQM